MNPGSGASNVDLSEAERLLKQSTAAPGLPNPAVPPHFMLMHQAVAMQQFQFQQALLLQQMMASQQAQARAATVKSAAEMAAARAAEISKQLKGNDPEGVEEKRSPDRSKSWSASRSRSLSKSRSRSPIRYRRDRSASRSPIRYRRDSRLSPSRSRDFYSYRSRSRRGYYRGRGDYPWNPSFRRDWDRDRDHYGRSSHRSRSRSPVRRRSRSHSHSPRGRRERSATPPRYRRDERRGAGRGSRRSRSRDLKPSPSHSSRSLSESIHGEDVSPRRKSKDSRRGESLSPEPKTGKRALSSSPAQGDQEKLDLEDRGGSKQGNGTAKLSLEHKGRTALSMSPRSLSVSLSPRQRSPEKQSEVDDDKLGMSAANNIAQEAGGRKTEGVTISEKAISNSTLSTWATEARVSPPEGIHEENPGGVRMKEKGKEFVARQGWQLRKESSGKGGDYVDDDSGEDKELDDWRDDMKAHEREKVKRKETKRESVKIEDKKSTAGQTPSIQDQERPAATLHGQTMKSSGKGNEVGSTVSVDLVGGFGVGMKRNIDAGGKELKKKLDVIKLKEVDRDLSDEDPTIAEKIERGVAEVGKRDQKVVCDADGSAGDATKEKTTGSTEDSEVEREVNVVFEGPKLPHDEGTVLKHTGRLGKSEDSTKELIRKSFKSSRDREDDKETGALQLELDDEDVLASYKRKEKSRSRERSKRHEDDVDRDRRKDRHRKHRRKHRHRDEETEKEDDDMIEDKADIEGGKEKEERRHHRKHHSRDTNDERRDRKRRKHKHRGKSASESPAPELQSAETEGGRDDILSRKKSLSSRDERRGDVLKSLGYSGSGSE